MNFFTVYWRDGTKTYLEGEDIADAFNKAGYGQGSLPAVDHYSAGFDFHYMWSAETKNWIPAPPSVKNASNVDLYEIVVRGVRFDPRVTESFLLDKFREKGFWYHLSGSSKLWVRRSDLEQIFIWKLE